MTDPNDNGNIEKNHIHNDVGASKNVTSLVSCNPSVKNNTNWWAAEDSYNLTAFGQINGVWPIDHPLALSDWSPEIKEPLVFDNVWQYEDLNSVIEVKLRRLLEETHYDTVHNFIDFYKSFKKTRRSDLRSFFQFYDIPINRRHHMCVSLAMEIVTRIVEIFPELAKHLYIVSCEEAVMAIQYYIENCLEAGMESASSNVEKEHALVAMKITIGGRQGMLILDPGYHVARAVTVMKDQCYPHTGWFTQSDEKHVKREYCYNYSRYSDNFIEWGERETRGEKQEYKVSLVYIERPYRTAIDVTVRRNLVYNFRSLLARNAKGRVCAGIYFPLVPNCADAQFTLFYDDQNDSNVKVKLKFNMFKNGTKIADNVSLHLEHLAQQLNINSIELLDIIKSLAEVVADQDFVTQVLHINEHINEMSADN